MKERVSDVRLLGFLDEFANIEAFDHENDLKRLDFATISLVLALDLLDCRAENKRLRGLASLNKGIADALQADNGRLQEGVVGIRRKVGYVAYCLREATEMIGWLEAGEAANQKGGE